MIEKVNPKHPDKVADRIAGAIVDLGYKLQENPKIAVEVLIGHGNCKIIIESSVQYNETDIFDIVYRIAETNNIKVEVILAKQDVKLAKNQDGKIRCGDNGIFKGMPLTEEQKEISKVARFLYDNYNSDGKYILDKNKLIICQSNASKDKIHNMFNTTNYYTIVNPLGEWTGGINVDTGATNRKLGSDMADAVTGGGLHGKDLSKADVSVNIYAHLKAQQTGKPVELCCAIGDEEIDGKPYSEIAEIAKEYIDNLGGFEKLAEWGLY
jgi:S-adenosylmethionine synthetase